MAALQNRGMAVLLCLVMILGACVVGTGTSLRTLRGQAETDFTAGSIKSDLDYIAEQCYNITAVAGRYPSAGSAAARVTEKREALRDASTPREKHRAAEEAMAAANTLMGVLRDAGPTDLDNDLARSCIAEIQSGMARIARSPYNEAAHAYNRTMETFPVNIFGGLSGVRPLELYE